GAAEPGGNRNALLDASCTHLFLSSRIRSLSRVAVLSWGNCGVHCGRSIPLYARGAGRSIESTHLSAHVIVLATDRLPHEAGPVGQPGRPGLHEGAVEDGFHAGRVLEPRGGSGVPPQRRPLRIVEPPADRLPVRIGDE